MGLTKRELDDLERRDPLEDLYYGEEWPTEQECANDEGLAVSEPERPGS